MPASRSILTWSLLLAGVLTPLLALDGMIGFRNDLTGVFPDCRPVTSWSEYSYEERKQGRITWDEPTGERRQNIVWKKHLPMWGNGQPIIVDGKLILLREMRYWDEEELGPTLLCLDPATGDEHWSTQIHHLDDVPRSVVDLWMEERRWVAAKWRTAWRMHEVSASDQTTIDQIWQDAIALGLTSDKDKHFGSKMGDHQMGDTGRFWKGEPAERKQRMKTLEQHNLFNTAWNELSHNVPGRWMGETFPTPVSDGERIYIRTARHLLACYDLDGERQWQTIYTQARGYCDFASSPILVDGILLVYSASSRGSDTIVCRGFDPRTGRQRWEIPGGAPSYAIGTPVVLTLASGRRVVFLPNGLVIDPTDGRTLCTVPCHLADADNPVAHGDVVFMRNSQAGGGYGGDEKGVPKSLQAIKVTEDGSQVSASVLWRIPSGDDGAKEFQSGLVHLNGILFSSSSPGITVLDAGDGSILGSQRCRNRAWNLTIAGDTLLVGDNNDARITVLSADESLQSHGEQQVGQPIKIPDDMWHYRNEKSNWGVTGAPFPIFCSGNRIYLRTWYDLYCIGDSSQKTVLSARHR